jgi:hypothetical protein
VEGFEFSGGTDSSDQIAGREEKKGLNAEDAEVGCGGRGEEREKEKPKNTG